MNEAYAWMVSLRQVGLASIVFLLANTPVLGLRSDSTRTEVGDRGSIAFPIRNDGGSSKSLEGVRLSVSGAPSWFKILPTSDLGPQDILPGQEFSFSLDYVVGPTYSSSNSAVNMLVLVSQSSKDSVPSSWTWTFTSPNGFFRFAGSCIDNQGLSCGTAGNVRKTGGREYRSVMPKPLRRLFSNSVVIGLIFLAALVLFHPQAVARRDAPSNFALLGLTVVMALVLINPKAFVRRNAESLRARIVPGMTYGEFAKELEANPKWDWLETLAIKRTCGGAFVTRPEAGILEMHIPSQGKGSEPQKRALLGLADPSAVADIRNCQPFNLKFWTFFYTWNFTIELDGAGRVTDVGELKYVDEF